MSSGVLQVDLVPPSSALVGEINVPCHTSDSSLEDGAADCPDGQDVSVESHRLPIPLSVAGPPVRVLVYDDVGGKSYNEKTGKICGAVHILQCLHAMLGPHVTMAPTTALAICQGALRQADVFVMPGGITAVQGRTIGREGRRALRDFVARGGGYVGFCAGANLALSDRYPNNLCLCPAINLDPHYPDDIFWRGTGSVDLALTPAGQAILGVNSVRHVCYFNGPLLGASLSAGRIGVDSDLQVLATFSPEAQLARRTPLPRSAAHMPGTAAIVASSFGKGRVAVCSVHPEKPSCVRWDSHPGVVARLVLWTTRRLPVTDAA
eukprot:GGOE01044162.1.p1 GENE.GGOE01044162.1~~GGOE01044162.1.p1  ORF type:complete len:321 (-),score=62.98 GGOE01044162.1:582-1544(-)